MRIPWSVAAVAALLFASTLSPATSPLAFEEVHFESATVPLSPFKIKQAKKNGIELKPEAGILLSGRLRTPAGEGPFPAVVLVHGCFGIRPYQDAWAQELTQWGYVTLQVDYVGPRGLPRPVPTFAMHF